MVINCAYFQQYHNLVLQKYKYDDEWIKRNLGFSLEDGVSIIKVISSGFRFSNMWNILSAFCYEPSDIAQETGIDLRKVQSFFDCFTLPEIPTNQDYKDMFDFNEVNARPLLKHKGSYFNLQIYDLAEIFYEGLFFKINDDGDYRDTASENRGIALEDMCFDALAAVFPAANIHRNVIVQKGNGDRISEIDVLVIFGDRIIVLQAKAKRMTIQAKAGNDEALMNDFQRAVQNAYDQSVKCIDAIEAGGVTLIADDGKGQRIDLPPLSDIRKSSSEQTSSRHRFFYPLTVVLDPYQSLSSQAREFLDYQKADSICPPFVTDIFIFDLMYKILPSPIYFLSYLDKRTRYYERISTTSEFQLLAVHVVHNLWLENNVDFTNFDPTLSFFLDETVEKLYQPSPELKLADGYLTMIQESAVGELIKQFADSDKPEMIELGLFLLELNGSYITEINNGLKHIRETAKTKGESNFVSNCPSLSSGFLILCNAYDDQEAMKKLFAHCLQRKYIFKADRCFGLCLHPEKKEIRFVLFIKEKWQFDQQTEDRVNAFLPKNAHDGNIKLKPRKLGRNERCYCGSGKKYKNCCLGHRPISPTAHP